MSDMNEMLAMAMPTRFFLTKREIFCLVLAVVVAAAISEKSFRDGNGTPLDGRRRYIPYLATFWLPPLMLVFALLPCFGLLSFRHVLSVFFSVLLSMCVYDACLLPALPVLRRYVSARTCAVLWLLPNYLIFLGNLNGMQLDRPRWVVHLPVPVAQIACAVWAAGFCAVLGWKIAGHLRFRRRLLRHARPVEDPDRLVLWRRVQADAGFPAAPYRLVVSPAAATPLSIGLLSRTIRVVLPERTYTAEELELILRHELVHISRRDNVTKFFLAFCTAVCWFNPLMWLAMERSAQDIELSCDEAVLLGADEVTRRRYAELLLTTAGDGRGFTTCLAASASALRYRLRSVIHPPRRTSGALAAGALLFILIATCGYTSLAYDPLPGAEAVFPVSPPEDCTLRSVQWDDGFMTHICRCEDPQALFQQLEALEPTRFTGSYSFAEAHPCLNVYYDSPDGSFWVSVRERSLSVTHIGRPLSPREGDYYLPQGADLDALADLLVFADG